MGLQAGVNNQGNYQQQPTTRQQAAPGQWYIANYYFDAWLRLGHSTSLTITQHPIETGAQITDHSFLNQKTFSFEVGVTNALAQPVFVGNSNRSVNAYNLLVNLQASRQLLEINTKYGLYRNCLIQSIEVSDDFQSQDKMIASISLVQVILANSKTIKVSTNPQATDDSNRGAVPARPPLGTEARRADDLNRLKADFKKLTN